MGEEGGQQMGPVTEWYRPVSLPHDWQTVALRPVRLTLTHLFTNRITTMRKSLQGAATRPSLPVFSGAPGCRGDERLPG